MHGLLEEIAYHYNRARTLAGAMGLTPAQATVLGALHRLGPVPIRDIVVAIGSAPSTLTIGLDVLERKGFITRTRPEEDRRCVVVGLTEAGKQKLAQAS